MSQAMLKAVAKMAGIEPEDIVAGFENIQNLAGHGVHTLEQIDARLARIEAHLGIAEILPPETTDENERQDNGQERT